MCLEFCFHHKKRVQKGKKGGRLGSRKEEAEFISGNKMACNQDNLTKGPRGTVSLKGKESPKQWVV